MSTEINININGRQKRLKGWKATAAIIGVLALLGLGVNSALSVLYDRLL